MSKLIKIYEDLKKQNSEKIYLFKSGMFFIFIGKDAEEMSAIFNFKLTHLNEQYVKCGFPNNSFDKYVNLIKKLDYDIEVVNPNNNIPYSLNNLYSQLDVNNLLNEIISVDVKNLSVRDAYSFIDKIQEETKIILTNKGVPEN